MTIETMVGSKRNIAKNTTARCRCRSHDGSPPRDPPFCSSWPRRRFVLFATALPLVLLILSFPTPSLGFASNLVEGGSGCMIDLSTDEVIMNNQVVAFEDSTHPELYLAVVNQDESLQSGPIVLKPDDVDQIFTIKLINPDSNNNNNNNNLGDIQYAVETTEGASFVQGGCDGRRASSRVRNDPGVQLQITDVSKAPIRVWAGWATSHEAVQLTQELVFSANSGDNDDEKQKKQPPKPQQQIEDEDMSDTASKLDSQKQHDADVAAAAAEDHDELTKGQDGEELADKMKDLLDQLGNVEADAGSEPDQERLDLTKKVRQNLERLLERQKGAQLKQILDKNHVNTAMKLKRVYDEYAGKDKDSSQLKDDHPLKKVGERLSEGARDALREHKDRFEEQRAKLLERMKQRRNDRMKDAGPLGQADPSTEIRKDNVEYDQELDLRRYGYGVLFFVFANALVIQVCLWSGKRDKGRRDL